MSLPTTGAPSHIVIVPLRRAADAASTSSEEGEGGGDTTAVAQGRLARPPR